jgi:excisionase family DNA binding protein
VSVDAARLALKAADRELAEARHLLRVSFVVRRLDVAPCTVRNWIQAGRIAAIRIPGGKYRIHRDELARIEASRA